MNDGLQLLASTATAAVWRFSDGTLYLEAYGATLRLTPQDAQFVTRILRTLDPTEDDGK